MPTKKELLKSPIQHLDLKQHNVVPLVDAMHNMAYSARDTARAANIYDMMLRDTDCGVILCLAGSLISAGLQKIFVDLIRNNMVDAIVSTGANIVDQDFFEALGFKHYIATDLRPQLAGIKTPMTLLYPYEAAEGSASEVTALYTTAYAAKPNLQLIRIDDSRHFIMYDQPAAFDKAVQAFLKP